MKFTENGINPTLHFKTDFSDNENMISEETILEFQELVQRKYGRDITLEEASEILTDLTDYFFTLHLIDSRISEDII